MLRIVVAVLVTIVVLGVGWWAVGQLCIALELPAAAAIIARVVLVVGVLVGAAHYARRGGGV
jgi:hypothetical protein